MNGTALSSFTHDCVVKLLADTVSVNYYRLTRALVLHCWIRLAEASWSRYGWFKVSEFGAVVPGGVPSLASPMSSTRPASLGKHIFWASARQRQIARF